MTIFLHRFPVGPDLRLEKNISHNLLPWKVFQSSFCLFFANYLTSSCSKIWSFAKNWNALGKQHL